MCFAMCGKAVFKIWGLILLIIHPSAQPWPRSPGVTFTPSGSKSTIRNFPLPIHRSLCCFSGFLPGLIRTFFFQSRHDRVRYRCDDRFDADDQTTWGFAIQAASLCRQSADSFIYQRGRAPGCNSVVFLVHYAVPYPLPKVSCHRFFDVGSGNIIEIFCIGSCPRLFGV